MTEPPAHVSHEWDDEDYAKTLHDAYAEYRKSCYGDRLLPPEQVQETRQAFLSGIHWLATREQSYCPDELEAALRTVIGQFNPRVKRKTNG